MFVVDVGLGQKISIISYVYRVHIYKIAQQLACRLFYHPWGLDKQYETELLHAARIARLVLQQFRLVLSDELRSYWALTKCVLLYY